MLGHEEVTAGILAELGVFEELVRSTDEAGWQRPLVLLSFSGKGRLNALLELVRRRADRG